MNEANDELRTEYNFDFSTAERGRYYQSYLASCNVVKLDDDVAQRFPTAEAVNAALRAILQIAAQTASLTAKN